jgi:hypothetical protein
MPRYFFSTTHGDQRSAHEQAMEFPNDRAAWSEAVQCCGEILRDIDGHLQPNLEWRMDVNDENHELIYSLRLIPEAYRRIKPEV